MKNFDRDYTVVGFCSLHYGKDYMYESLMSIRDYVDVMHIAYSQKSSHGVVIEDLSCPDSEDELRKIAVSVFGEENLIWESYGGFMHEGEHRSARYKHSVGKSLILTIDVDEIYDQDTILPALDYARAGKARFYGTSNYLNFFRSFSHIVKDHFAPIRVENLTRDNLDHDFGLPLKVYHFGSALRKDLMRYKLKIYGHRDEVRPNYLDDIFFNWSPETSDAVIDLHPTSLGIWKRAEPFDKNALPELLKNHPNYNKHLIE